MAGHPHIHHTYYAVDTNATGQIVAAVTDYEFRILGAVLVSDTAGVEIALRDGASGNYMMGSASNGIPLAQYGGFVLPLAPNAGHSAVYWYRTTKSTRLDLVIVSGSGRITGSLIGYYWNGSLWSES